MDKTAQVNVFWFRRDLRLEDNAGLYRACMAGKPLLLLFIFDKNILNQLHDRNDTRLTFIHKALSDLNQRVRQYGSTLITKYNTPELAWEEILLEYSVGEVFLNSDYEPYARERDSSIRSILEARGISFTEFKDHVIFEKDEVVKDNGEPYTIYTPYRKKWYFKFHRQGHLKSFSSLALLPVLTKLPFREIPRLEELGFKASSIEFPPISFTNICSAYKDTRDIPSLNATSRLSVHLRFGTISIREVVSKAIQCDELTYLDELIWREFYSMILWFFPDTATSSFRKEFDQIPWRNNESEFEAWCNGNTGFPMVDAGMRQLNATGWMHNRLRMVTASFLCKDLLIDWRWGEAYFARKLIDYDMASNVGGWQWTCGSGTDAAPYFRIFNPALQAKRFDPSLEFIMKWVPEFSDPFKYPAPIIDHKMAAERALTILKKTFSDHGQ